jgi:hypothetical protein
MGQGPRTSDREVIRTFWHAQRDCWKRSLARAHRLPEAERSEPGRVLRVSWTVAEEFRHPMGELAFRSTGVMLVETLGQPPDVT